MPLPLWLLSAIGAVKRVPPWLWSVLGVLAAIVLVLSVAECGLRRAETSAVKADRAESSADATSRVLNADSAATTNQMARDAIATNQQQELRDEARKGDSRPVGPGTSAVLDRMRDQQSKGGR